MEIPFTDFHTHSLPRNGVISAPTFRLGIQEIPAYIERFWIGVHPWDSQTVSGDIFNAIDSFGSRVLGVGEIGLDYYHNSDNIEEQKELFKSELNYAIKKKLPITIHCVRGYNDLIKILREFKNAPKNVAIHGFIGSIETVKELLELNCYISYGASVLNSNKSINALRNTPINRLFLESDDNIDIQIEDLYREISKLINIDKTSLKQAIFNNYNQFLNG